jgi:glutathione S-transferase
MDEQILFYTNPRSRGAIARWMLEETGKPYEEVVLAFGPPMKSTEYRALNPMGKVPAIVHQGRVVTETAAICLYLADVFRDSSLHPEPGEKADYYRWILIAAGPVEQATTARALGWEVPNERRGMAGFGSYESVLETLEQALNGKDFICGRRFTAADVYFGSQITKGLAFGSLPKTLQLEAYRDRLIDRPAYKRARARDAALVAETPANS